MKAYRASVIAYRLLIDGACDSASRKMMEDAFRDTLQGVLRGIDEDPRKPRVIGGIDSWRGSGCIAVQGHVLQGADIVGPLSTRIAFLNRLMRDEIRIRVMFALHFGTVWLGEKGHPKSGPAIDLANAMLEAMPHDRDGLVAISDSYHRLLVDHADCPEKLFHDIPDLKGPADGAIALKSFFTDNFGIDISRLPSPEDRLRATRIVASLDNYRVRDLEGALFDAVEEATWRIELPQLGGAARIRGLPIDELYIELIADPTSPDEHRWAREIDPDTGLDASTRDGAWRDILRPSPTRAERKILNEELPDADGVRPRIARPPPRPEARAALGRAADWSEPQTEAAATTSANPDGELLHAVLRRERCCVVLGDPGSGKSVLCRWVAKRLAHYRRAGRASPELGPPRAPFLIQARDLAAQIAEGRETSLVDYIKTALRPEVPAAEGEAWEQYVEQLLEAGHAFVIIDGLDEMPSERQGALKRMIDSFVDLHVVRPGVDGSRPDAGIGNQILVTSRITGYYQTALTSPAWSIFLIRPMPDALIARFCNHWCEAAEIPALAEPLRAEMFSPRNATILSISRNPLLLSILCQLATFDPTRVTLPKGRTELYEQVIVETAERWRTGVLQEPRGRTPEFMRKLSSAESILTLFAPAAEHIHRKSITGNIGENDLVLHLVRAIARLEGRHDTELSAQEAKERRAYIKVRLSQVFGVLSERARGQYSFLHRTFQEYLAGLSLLLPDPSGTECFNAPFRIPADVVADRILKRELLGDPHWRQPLLFLLGQLAWAQEQRERGLHREAPEMIAVIGHIEERRAEWDEQLSAEEWALFLADLLVELPPDFSAVVGSPR